MTDDEKFFERLRGDAASLRYRIDDAGLSRIRVRIQDRVARPTVAQLLAAWLRPLAATLTAVAVAAAIGLASMNGGDDATTFSEERVEIVLAGDTYIVE